MLADGLDAALLGVDCSAGRAVYSCRKVIELLQERDGMTREEALEFAYFNIFTSYVGELTPVWVEDDF